MDFDQLRTFLEIVRLKSFSKAAQTCYRTQPAISAQVRQLEQELRTELFERFGSRISLTTAGRIFADYAQQMLDLRHRAQDDIAELEINPRGELVIAANEATCIYVLPMVFSQFKALFPAVQLQLDRSYGSRVVEAVMDNSADFGLTQLPVEDEIRISMELDSTETMKRFVMAGMGLTFLAVSNFREEIAAGRLKDVPLLPEPLVRRLGLIYRKDKALSKAALGFIHVVLEQLGDGVQGTGRGDRVVA